MGRDVLTRNIGIENELDIGVADKPIRRAQLDNRINDPVPGFGVLQVQLKTFINHLVNVFQLLTIA